MTRILYISLPILLLALHGCTTLVHVTDTGAQFSTDECGSEVSGIWTVEDVEKPSGEHSGSHIHKLFEEPRGEDKMKFGYSWQQELVVKNARNKPTLRENWSKFGRFPCLNASVPITFDGRDVNLDIGATISVGKPTEVGGAKQHLHFVTLLHYSINGSDSKFFTGVVSQSSPFSQSVSAKGTKTDGAVLLSPYSAAAILFHKLKTRRQEPLEVVSENNLQSKVDEIEAWIDQDPDIRTFLGTYSHNGKIHGKIN